MITLYVVIHLLTGKSYIGWTSRDVVVRWNEHKQDAFRVCRSRSYYFHNALRKHGSDAFSWEVVQHFDTEDEAKQAEIFWIAELNTNVNRGGFGYNETDGGEGNNGYYNEENRKKASDRVKALGDAHNMRWPEARKRQADRMRNSDINPLLREDVRAKTSERMKAMGDAHYVHRAWHRQKLTETSRTPEALAKRSDANKGEKNPGAKLTWTDVEFIRASSKLHRELAEKFDVSMATISLIKRFKIWNRESVSMLEREKVIL